MYGNITPMNLPPEIEKSQLEIEAALRIQTLGGFRIWRAREDEITPAVWGREKALHLFQFFVTLCRTTLSFQVR